MQPAVRVDLAQLLERRPAIHATLNRLRGTRQGLPGGSYSRGSDTQPRPTRDVWDFFRKFILSSVYIIVQGLGDSTCPFLNVTAQCRCFQKRLKIKTAANE